MSKKGRKRNNTNKNAQRDLYTKSSKRLLSNPIVSVDLNINRKRRFIDNVQDTITQNRIVTGYRKTQEYKNRLKAPFTTSALLLKEKV